MYNHLNGQATAACPFAYARFPTTIILRFQGFDVSLWRETNTSLA
jgi:hypothetical protein